MGKSKVEHDFRITPFHVNNSVTGSSVLVEVDGLKILLDIGMFQSQTHKTEDVYKINYKPAKKLPIEEFLKPQKRFKHMFKPGNEWMIEEFQKEVDARWQELLDLEEITNK